MNAEDRHAIERRVAAWLDDAAPEPPPDLAARLLRHTAELPQRTRGGAFDMFAIRMVAVAAVIATAAVIGLGIANVIGPQPPVGTPQPTPPASASASVQPSPSASSEPSVEPTPSSVAEPGLIAFSANRSNATSGIYVMNPDGSNVVELVDDPAVHELDPIWSPDGSLVTYHTMSADGSMQGGVFIIGADGGEPVLVDDNYAYGPATWSPDGSMLILGGDGAERGLSLYRVAEDRLDQLTDDGGTAPVWSPDGSMVAYNVARPPSGAGALPLIDIAIVDVASGETRLLTDDDWADSVARWADDGQRIVFTSDRETDRSAPSLRSWVVDAVGGEPELLGDGQLLARAQWTSPDGAWLAYAAQDGSGLHLSRADGSEDRLVHPDVPADLGASWSPDSSGFVFSDTADARDLWVMRVDAEAPVQITSDAADESAPNWGPSSG
jgi:Tol biopolymer transport system component